MPDELTVAAREDDARDEMMEVVLTEVEKMVEPNGAGDLDSDAGDDSEVEPEVDEE